MKAHDGPDGDPFQVCCSKFGITPKSREGIAVGHVDIDRCWAVPIYFIASERLDDAALTERLALVLGFELEELVDFVSCNMDPLEARELIRSRRPA